MGVAYADEGVYLRKKGIAARILVMNADPAAFDDCIHYNLDLAIGGTWVLNSFLDKAVEMNLKGFPIHLKLNTGMNRMGFDLDELSWVCQSINSQPEVNVKTVFSHLARAEDGVFSQEQVRRYKDGVAQLKKGLKYSFDTHQVILKVCYIMFLKKILFVRESHSMVLVIRV